ncbi:MAG: L-fuculose-phosphate aldolase [Bacillota bacterium]
MKLEKERKLIVEYGKKLIDSDLTTGTGGNLSILNKDKNLVAISPSGVDYYQLKKEDIVVIDLNGNSVEGKNKPSSELAMHLAVYKNRKDMFSVVHTHSIFATSIACLNIDLPAVHYMIAVAGDKVPCAKYASFGTEELAQNAVKSLGSKYKAVLLANHGVLSCGIDIKNAFNIAEEIEYVAEVYFRTKAIGDPVIIDAAEMERMDKAFETYGQ